MPSEPASPEPAVDAGPDSAGPATTRTEKVPATPPAAPRQAPGPPASLASGSPDPRPAALGLPAMNEVERAAALAALGEAPSRKAGRRFPFFGFAGRKKHVSAPPAAAVSSDVVVPSPDPPTGEKDVVKLKEPFPSERPPGAPADPWTAFVSAPERPPGLMLRATHAFFRSLIHEYALAIYAGLLLAVGLTWPTLRYPLHTLPQDLGDPARQAWQISWIGHILLTHPQQLWQSNAFYPEPSSFAFGDSLLGYGPLGMLGDGPLAATLRYNILFVLAHALLAIGGYALVRQLGAGRTGAAVAAVAIAYAPWRLAQEGHLDIISAGGIPLALAMLARGHGWSLRRGLQPTECNAGWAAFGWLVAAWQVSLGFSLGLPFLGVLGVIVLLLLFGTPMIWLRRRSRRRAQQRTDKPAEAAADEVADGREKKRRKKKAPSLRVAHDRDFYPVLGWRLLIIDALGPVILAGITALIALPYFHLADKSNSTAEIKFFSPPLWSLLIGPSESRIWGSPHAGARASLGWAAEMSLLPGFVLYALALAGLWFSVWRFSRRILLMIALAASIVLTIGTNFFGGHWTYLPLFGHLPASLGQRIPGRMMLWVTLLLGILAAGAVAEFVRRAEHWSAQRIPPWPAWWLRLATLVPLILVIAEGWNTTGHPVVPAQPASMRTITNPMLVLPTGAVTDGTVMLWSTTRYQKIANGSGGFAAARQDQMRTAVAGFPDAASIEYLRSMHVTTVLLIRSAVAGTPWERAGDTPVDSLGITREDTEDAVVFHLG